MGSSVVVWGVTVSVMRTTLRPPPRPVKAGSILGARPWARHPGPDRATLDRTAPRHTRAMAERTELAEFLRARRNRLTPADVGLPDNGRRRTPGLRREEVATLAGVSIDYLVRLEQGRDTRPSASVIAALADALRLDDEQRRQLYTLATISQSAELCPAARPLTREVAPTVTALLKGLDPTPAFVVGPSNDVLGWNDAWAHLVGPLGMLDDASPNLARHVFLHPLARTVYADWTNAA